MDDDEEDYEPILPKRSDPPPLKRLWVAPPEPEAASSSAPAVKSKRVEPVAEPKVDKPKKKKKAVEEPIDDGTGAIKLEATPALDTYEARQRVRWIIGTIAIVIGLFFLVIVLKAFKGNGPEEAGNAESSESRSAAGSRANAEPEARILLDMAKQADRDGKTATAVDQLKKLTKNYDGTVAAREALIALDRHKQDKSLFGEDEPTQLSGPKAPPPGSGTARGPVIARPGTVANPAPVGSQPAEQPPSVVVAPPPPPPVTKPLPPGYRPNFQFPIHPSGWPTRISCDRDGAELVLVPATTFLMGRNDGEPQEAPSHEVFVSTYYIDLHEVTVGQYVRFLKETSRAVNISRLTGKGPSASTDLPVVNVTFGEAKEYTAWSKRRLPTEAQWELAARGPDGRISYFSEVLPRPDPEKGDRPMEDVMSLKSDLSPYGAFDMGANAWEWTSEWYDSKYYLQFRNRVSDPTGPKDRLARVGLATLKGGSKQGVLTWRDGVKIETRKPYIGFRGALPVEGAPIDPPKAPVQDAGPARNGGVVPF